MRFGLKHVARFGPWRLAWRFGRYQPGYIYRGPGHYTAALPFMWGSLTRFRQWRSP